MNTRLWYTYKHSRKRVGVEWFYRRYDVTQLKPMCAIHSDLLLPPTRDAQHLVSIIRRIESRDFMALCSPTRVGISRHFSLSS